MKNSAKQGCENMEIKMTTTDTPRTDDRSSDHIGFWSCATVPSIFARQLERELSHSLANQLKTQAEVEHIKGLLKDISAVHINTLRGNIATLSWDSYEHIIGPHPIRKRAEKAEAEVAELNSLMIGWKQRATMSETDLEASKAEVERLKELVNESIIEKSNLSIALVNCQANLRRAIDVARMLPVIPIPAISSRDITDTLYAELNQLKATLNPATKESSAHQL